MQSEKIDPKKIVARYEGTFWDVDRINILEGDVSINHPKHGSKLLLLTDANLEIHIMK